MQKTAHTWVDFTQEFWGPLLAPRGALATLYLLPKSMLQFRVGAFVEVLRRHRVHRRGGEGMRVEVRVTASVYVSVKRAHFLLDPSQAVAGAFSSAQHGGGDAIPARVTPARLAPPVRERRTIGTEPPTAGTRKRHLARDT